MVASPKSPESPDITPMALEPQTPAQRVPQFALKYRCDPLLLRETVTWRHPPPPHGRPLRATGGDFKGAPTKDTPQWLRTGNVTNLFPKPQARAHARHLEVPPTQLLKQRPPIYLSSPLPPLPQLPVNPKAGKKETGHWTLVVLHRNPLVFMTPPLASLDDRPTSPGGGN